MAKKDKKSAKKSFPKDVRKSDEPGIALEKDLVLPRLVRIRKSPA